MSRVRLPLHDGTGQTSEMDITTSLFGVQEVHLLWTCMKLRMDTHLMHGK